MSIKTMKLSDKFHGMEEESILIMLISQETLKKDWNNKYDERWNKY